MELSHDACGAGRGAGSAEGAARGAKRSARPAPLSVARSCGAGTIAVATANPVAAASAVAIQGWADVNSSGEAICLTWLFMLCNVRCIAAGAASPSCGGGLAEQVAAQKRGQKKSPPPAPGPHL